MKTITTWKQDHQFKSSQNHNLIELDGSVKNGMSPKALLLSGLAGCSGIDLVDILEKMRILFSDLVIEASAEQTDGTPKVFKSVNLLYRIHTDRQNESKVIKAIELSLDKYCGVAAMLKKNSPIRYKLEII